MANSSKRPREISNAAIGDRVRQLRKHYELTQASFASAIHSNQKEVSLVEAGKFPSQAMLGGLLASYPISGHWLLTGERAMFVENVAETKAGYQAEAGEHHDRALKDLREAVGLLESGEHDAAVGRAFRAIFSCLSRRE